MALLWKEGSEIIAHQVISAQSPKVLRRLGKQKDCEIEGVAKTIRHQCPPHHWIVSQPDGPVCHGRCKFCRSEKDFFPHRSEDEGIKRPNVTRQQRTPVHELNRQAKLHPTQGRFSDQP